MSLDVLNYQEHHSRVWDQFVDKSGNGTIFHTRRFLNYHPGGRFQDHSLIFQNGSTLLAVIPAALTEEEKCLHSHPGASYGGFVCRRNLSLQDAFHLTEALLDYGRTVKLKTIRMTLPPAIYHEQINNHAEFALIRRGFRYQKRELSSVVFLGGENFILDGFKPEARTATRRAVKTGVQIKITHNFDAFYSILQNNLAMRHQVTPTHTLEELKKLYRLFPRRIMQFESSIHDRIIAGVTLFICNRKVILAFYISHDTDYQRYRPVNLIFYEIMKWGREHGYRFLDFGIFTVNGNPNWGLAKFKESFGARGVFRDTLIYEYGD
ncbi:MAG TPA: GNAT family N-acetyltransferase [bacterium]|nr:GNAT family N-acetyltransferase [bacterium]